MVSTRRSRRKADRRHEPDAGRSGGSSCTASTASLRLLSRRSSVPARNAQHHSAGASAPVAVWSDATGLNTTNAKSSIDATIVSEAKAAMGSAASYPAWIAATAIVRMTVPTAHIPTWVTARRLKLRRRIHAVIDAEQKQRHPTQEVEMCMRRH